MQVKTVKIVRQAKTQSLGFVMATYEDGAVIVDDVMAGGLAESVQLAKGDQILLINSELVTGKDHGDVVTMLSMSADVSVTFAYRLENQKVAIGQDHKVKRVSRHLSALLFSVCAQANRVDCAC